MWLAVVLLLLGAISGFWVLRLHGVPPPPTPVIDPASVPADPTHGRSAAFAFSTPRTVTFECSLDGSGFSRCGYGLVGSKSYPGPLGVRRHTFEVRSATSRGVSAAASFSWTIVGSTPGQPCVGGTGACGENGGAGQGADGGKPPAGGADGGSSPGGGQPGGGQAPTGSEPGEGGSEGDGSEGSGTGEAPSGEEFSFHIAGGVTGLAPGVTRTLTLTLTNPNTVPIFVTRLIVAISADSKPSGCSSATNIVLHQATGITSGAPLRIPAKGTVRVSRPPLAPRISFRNLASNQDACKKKSFTLVYTGSAHS